MFEHSRVSLSQKGGGLSELPLRLLATVLLVGASCMGNGGEAMRADAFEVPLEYRYFDLGKVALRDTCFLDPLTLDVGGRDDCLKVDKQIKNRKNCEENLHHFNLHIFK